MNMTMLNKTKTDILSLAIFVIALAVCSANPSAVFAAIMQEVFATPEQAVDALVSATREDKTKDLLKILGPHAGHLIHSGDAVADRMGRGKFVAAYDAAHSLQDESGGKMILTVGQEEWPMPIPLVKTDNGWRFDAGAGEQEILDRRIGRNELNVAEVCRAYVEAQREFANQRFMAGGEHEYAQRLLSTKGKHDGLYWPTSDSGDKESPLGPLIAQADAEGYPGKAVLNQRAPYHGYYYKILKRQGPGATGGKMDYMVHGHMIGGFALLAFPARYGDSGVMTFIVNQNGIVYEKNLGVQTTKLAANITQYDPDESWAIFQ